jgi:hypothetical protein
MIESAAVSADVLFDVVVLRARRIHRAWMKKGSAIDVGRKADAAGLCWTRHELT